MGRSEEFDDPNNSREETDVVSDTYTSESADDVYRMPDVTREGTAEQGQDKDSSLYGVGAPSGPDGGQWTQSGNPYQNSPYGNEPYGSRQGQEGSPYGNGSYGSQQGQNGNPYGNQQGQNGNPYGNQQGQNGSPYGSQQGQNGNPYGNQQGQNGNPYGNQQEQNGSPYGNQYSPYAVPAKKSNTKLIIGIVAGIILLFLIAVFALTYKAVSLFSEERERRHRDDYEEHIFHDDREKNREKRREEDDLDPYDYDDDYYDDDHYYDDHYYDDYYQDDYYDDDFYHDYYDDYYGDGYDYDNDEYYTLHDAVRSDLSYTVDFEYYEYDTDDEDVEIAVAYPVIKGDRVPNLEQLNALIQSEIDLFEDYYEEEYIQYMEDENSYFSALSSGYVTYMDEEKLSIVFSEYIYTDSYDYAYLYSINIDMENGVAMDNESILSIDDDFSVEFRKRSDEQNGEITYLTGMTDQEITDYFNSPDVIVFYTPHGMEIGFNYEAGWVTVTYREYEQYLKVF